MTGDILVAEKKDSEERWYGTDFYSGEPNRMATGRVFLVWSYLHSRLAVGLSFVGMCSKYTGAGFDKKSVVNF
jgi:hypothetical protein